MPKDAWTTPSRAPRALAMTLVGGRSFHNGNKWQTCRCPRRAVSCLDPNLRHRTPRMTTVSLTLSQVFEFAVKAYQMGKLPEAEQLCLKILSADPDSTPTLNR